MSQMVRVVKVCPYADYAVVEWVGKKYEPWVACWAPRKCTSAGTRNLEFNDIGKEVTCYWSQGHYFKNFEDALEYALDRETEAFGKAR